LKGGGQLLGREAASPSCPAQSNTSNAFSLDSSSEERLALSTKRREGREKRGQSVTEAQLIPSRYFSFILCAPGGDQ